MNESSGYEVPERFYPLIDFLDIVFQKDQSDLYHSGAPACYKMLIDRQKEFVGTPIEGSFWNAVSLETFHIAQNEAMEGNIESTMKYLEISFEASKKGISREWEAYVKGTKCYFEGDMAGLQAQMPKAGENKRVLQHLLNGYLHRVQGCASDFV